MKVLMLSPILPWPLNMGSKIRIYHVLRELARKGHEVTLACLSEEDVGPSDLEMLKSYCRELKVVYKERKSRTWVALRALFSLKSYGMIKFENQKLYRVVTEILRQPHDILWVHCLESLAYLPKLERGLKPVVILDEQNADERLWNTFARSGLLWVRFFAWQNIWKLRRFQRQVLQQVDVVLSVSEEDAAFTRRRLPNPSTQVWVVPNGVDIEYFRFWKDEEKKKNRIIFCGSMDIFMNIDAAVWFAKKIFPRIREFVSDVELWVVGRNPAPEVRALGSFPGIYVTGLVDDVRPYYAQAKVAVAPFRYGGGTKLKVLEAMALGVPVVATPVGCQGIGIVPGRHLFLAEGEEMFAQRVIALLRDENLRKRIALEARRLVEQKYSWQSILGETIARLEQLIKAKAHSRGC